MQGRLEDKDKDLRLKDKDFRSKNKGKTRTCKLVLEDKDNDFPRGQQHWVTVKNDLLTGIYQ